MRESDVQRIEVALGLSLPRAYRDALLRHDLPGEARDHCEFSSSVDVLLSRNEHFRRDPESLPPADGRALRQLLEWVLPGMKRRRLDENRAWLARWAGEKRFVVGDDESEEIYFVRLTEADGPVYCYDAETSEDRVVAATVGEWIEKIRGGRYSSGDT